MSPKVAAKVKDDLIATGIFLERDTYQLFKDWKADRVANSCRKSVDILCYLQISIGGFSSGESRRTEAVAGESCRPRVRLTPVYRAQMDQGWQDPGDPGGKRSTSAPLRD
jgi:hypothetical protein